MSRRVSEWKRRGLVSAALACACAGLALGGTGIAAAAVDQAVEALPPGFAPFTPASIDSRLARIVAERGGDSSHLMRFTPAGAAGGLGRSVTVAIRIDDETAHAISVRSAIASASEQVGGHTIEIAPTRYDLGVARGYRSFAQAKPAVALAPAPLPDIAMPDLSEYRPTPVGKDKPSRFSAHVALEKDPKTGRAEGTRESLGDQTVDVGGALRVTRNLNVTAGVRYSQDRDRIAPLTDGAQDSQAVYLGTQFRF